MDDDLQATIDRVAADTGLSGVVRVDRPGEDPLAQAYGLADRGHGIANTVDTRFGIASGSKGLTALAVVSLIESGTLALDTTARSLLGDDLPAIDDAVTVEHLMAHRSGIGEYLPEDEGLDINEYLLTIPVHGLVATEDFVPMLDGRPQIAPPGQQFKYCNGGFVVLALLAERASGVSYHDLVRQRVCEPAGMVDTEFLRSDEPGARTALGYLGPDGLRTNLLHLPVVATGDGGIHTTVADVRSLWLALFAGAVVAPSWLEEMTRPRSDVPEEEMRYGLGFWLHASADRVMLVGYDAGVSFRSVHEPGTGTTHTVVANTSEGAWPVSRHLDTVLWGQPTPRQ